MCLFPFSSGNTLKKKTRRVWSPDGSSDQPPPYASVVVSTTSLIRDSRQPVNPPSYRFSQQDIQLQPETEEVIEPVRPRRRSQISNRRVSVSYPLRTAQSVPEMSTTQQNTVYGGRNHSRGRSSGNLPSASTGRLPPASQSTTNLNDPRSSNPQLYERISARLNELINEIDHEVMSENGYDLETQDALAEISHRTVGPIATARNLVTAAGGGNATSGNSKVWLYANSRLPPFLPPLKVYIPTYPLFCLAAQYSLKVYERPTETERADHIRASLLHRTKAMTLKSLPLDDMNTIVFAIRGSVSFTDWGMNFRLAPASPEGFLDDPGNLCHAGFLSIAKSMIKPVAARLRTLLEENPSRSTSSLLITGHSAGAAVAQLLYAHMLSKSVDSELNYLVGFFKRVHCITFGSPPVSLLPLTTPKSKQNKKSLFFTFVNEGDPVSRADKAIMKSLLKLYASPTPKPDPSTRPTTWNNPDTWAAESYAYGPIWKVPNATLSIGGRIVLLRPRFDGSGPEDVEAVTASDELLRDVVFGDPACHTMTMYSKRIETLATQAVTVGAFRS